MSTSGPCNRDGKHSAAENMWRKIRKLPGFGMETHEGDEMTNLNRDMLRELRDYCVCQRV